MSYCRFRNTLLALKDCCHNRPDKDLSEGEASAFADLVQLCKEIAENYEDCNYDELLDLSIKY